MIVDLYFCWSSDGAQITLKRCRSAFVHLEIGLLGVCNCSKCDFQCIILFVRCQIFIGLGLGLSLIYKYSAVFSVIFKNLLSVS